MFTGRAAETVSNYALIVGQSLFRNDSKKIFNGQRVRHSDIIFGGPVMKLTFLIVT